MIVTHLNLTNYRNYRSFDVSLLPGTNLFVGSNGQGKTNLVEALGYLSTLGSHRVSVDRALILQGEDSAIIRVRIAHADREILAEVQINLDTANRAQVNRAPIRTRELPRYFSSVLFAPEDLALVRSDPAVRRRFLDALLVLRNPRLSSVLADYERVVRQRNALLKAARNSRRDALDTLAIWDEPLVTLGSEIIEARGSLAEELGPEVNLAYSTIADADHGAALSSYLSIMAASPDPEGGPANIRTTRITAGEAEEAFRAALSRLRRAERERGMTLVGPHRDDLVLELNGLPARGYASHGESWSFALALKLASAAVLRRESAVGDPVLILDDVFAELDESRRGRLATAVADFEQVLITAAVLGDVPESLATRVVRISAGRIVESDDRVPDD